MGQNHVPAQHSRRRTAILISLVAAFILIIGVAQAMTGSGTETAVQSKGDTPDAANEGDIQPTPEITSTATFDERIEAYIDGHTLTVEEATALGFYEPQLDETGAAMTITTFLPVAAKAPPILEISATRPNSANDWTVSWEMADSDLVTKYELQESQNPNFSGATTYDMGLNTSRDFFDHQPSPNNTYYYRVRAVAGEVLGGWSQPLLVAGGYRDDFSSNTTGWDVRRTTFIEEVTSFYENNDWFILRVEDSWDWGIASPGKPAPAPPYVINYRVKHANIEGNLKSNGMVFGGDWPGIICPDKSTVAGWYEHELCFNQFYNTNTIWFGGSTLKLLFERVDDLIWCPTCGGSPMKRLGDIDENNTKDLNNVSPNDWNTYRIEVRSGEIKYFANGVLQFTYNDTRYIDQPYFGVFSSTDEYSNSTARFDYVEVLPLDN